MPSARLEKYSFRFLLSFDEPGHLRTREAGHGFKVLPHEHFLLLLTEGEVPELRECLFYPYIGFFFVIAFEFDLCGAFQELLDFAQTPDLRIVHMNDHTNQVSRRAFSRARRPKLQAHYALESGGCLRLILYCTRLIRSE